jgi:hypothetical protein
MHPNTQDHNPTAFANREVRRTRMLRFAGLLAVVVWAAAVGVGLERLWRYKTTAGVAASTTQQWPGSSLITPQSGHATLIMFVHPQCSCTRASLEELRNVMERAQRPVSAWVLLLQPEGTSGDWQRTATAEAARRIPNVTVVTDRQGIEAQRFGAATSGQVVLFDDTGHLVFAGGITGSRGHVGNNTGERLLLSLINTGAAEGHHHVVFGCGLHDAHRTET